MQYITKIFSKDFCDSSSKQAYLDACTWVAANILSKSSNVPVEEVTWNIKRKESGNKEINIFTLTIYVKIDEKEVKEQHCRICKQAHELFYMNVQDVCHECKLNAYFKRAKEKGKNKALLIKEKIEGSYGYDD